MTTISYNNDAAMRMATTSRPGVEEWSRRAAAGKGGPSENPQLREKLGEFVGDIFYGTMIRQMNDSKLKGEYFHGGRGEQVFQAQLGMELARRMGRATGDPISNHLYDAWTRQTGAVSSPLDDADGRFRVSSGEPAATRSVGTDSAAGRQTTTITAGGGA